MTKTIEWKFNVGDIVKFKKNPPESPLRGEVSTLTCWVDDDLLTKGYKVRIDFGSWFIFGNFQEWDLLKDDTIYTKQD